MHFEKIRYKNKDYAVIKIKYKDLNLPIVIDWQDLPIINDLQKSWKCNKYGFISCNHNYNNTIKEVYMHDIVMALKQRSNGKKKQTTAIVHINRIGLDNRRENIMYDTTDKELNKNIKKKKRTIKLPESSGVNVNDIPTYVWYMKPDSTHGERFMVDIGDIQWKTTSSKKLSLRYKLEEAKAFLRGLKQTNPELFEEYSMNGDYTKDGKNLLDSYYTIVHKAGYTHINKYIPKNRTDNLLKVTTKNKKERNLLKDQKLTKSEQRRRVFNNLPKDSGVTSQDLPKYAYYRPAYNGRGDYFVVDNHPKQYNKLWQTSTSKTLTTYEKYQQLLQYLNTLESSNNNLSELSDSFSDSSSDLSTDSTSK